MKRTSRLCRIIFVRQCERLLDVAVSPLVEEAGVEGFSFFQAFCQKLSEPLPALRKIIRHNTGPLFVRVVPYFSSRSPKRYLVSRIILVIFFFLRNSGQRFGVAKPLSHEKVLARPQYFLKIVEQRPQEACVRATDLQSVRVIRNPNKYL